MRPKISKWQGDPAKYVQFKLDGHYVEIHVRENGEDTHVQALTRHPSDITDFLKHRGFFKRIEAKVPRGLVLLGELYVVGGTSSDVPTALREDNDRLQFSVFAVYSTLRGANKGSGKKYDFRQSATVFDDAAPLELVHDQCTFWGLQFTPYRLWTPKDTPERLLESIKHMDDAPEGFVLKDGNRSNWRKLKPEPTVDLVVTGTTDGDGKFLGLIGSLRCSARKEFSHGKLIEVARVSGMTDDMRIELTTMEDALIGKIVEVKYQGVGSRGRLRHPRFMRLRDDKTAKDASIFDVDRNDFLT